MEIRQHLQQLHEEGNYRQIPTVTPLTLTDYSTNDYMGLAADATLQAKFFADPISATVPLTSSAARLLAPRQIEYTNLEVFLTLLYKKRRGSDTAALLFNSGYHANTGLISSIADKSTLIVADRLVHASIIDGIVLSRAPFQRFRHNDFDHLEEIISQKGGDYRQILVIVESVYSMDGDRADMERLIALKRKYPGMTLYVDEAHAFGVLGPKGLMPNPKSGTVTMDVARAVQEVKAGKVEYRLDKTAIIHCPIGKKSFGTEKLAENFNALMDAIVKAKPATSKGQYIKSVTLTATMGPGVKVTYNKG